MYFGVTSRKPEYRWGKNGNGYKQKLIKNKIEKYSWDNIEHIILYDNLNELNAYQLEKDYIKYYDTSNYINGYNRAIGGKSNSGFKWTDEQKLHLPHRVGYESPNYGLKRSNEVKEKIRKSHTGINNCNYGKHRSDETKKKISDKTKMKIGKYNSHATKVLCIDTGEIFDTIKDASLKYNVDNSCITKCCRGKRNYSGKLSNGTKLHWKYLNDKEIIIS